MESMWRHMSASWSWHKALVGDINCVGHMVRIHWLPMYCLHISLSVCVI